MRPAQVVSEVRMMARKRMPPALVTAARGSRPRALAASVQDKETVPVYLRSDEEVPYGFVLKVMATVEREGYLNLSLVADQPTDR